MGWESPARCAGALPANATIPRVVHQSWKTAAAPSQLRPLSDAWASLDGFDHHLWTDAENRGMWARHFPELLPVYDGYTDTIAKADASRLVYMYVHGGIYADLGAPHAVIAAHAERRRRHDAAAEMAPRCTRHHTRAPLNLRISPHAGRRCAVLAHPTRRPHALELLFVALPRPRAV